LDRSTAVDGAAACPFDSSAVGVIAVLALPPVGTGNKSQSPGSRDVGCWLQHFCHSGCKNHSAPAFRIDIDKICSQSLIGRRHKPGPHMHKVKSLLLGTVAGFAALGGAQAADMPAKARPVQYVKICSLYGDGFYYIPGTDTCLKLGGYLRA
jgi:Porin subfamily